MWGAYFCMGAYKHDVVVVINMGAYIHGVLIFCVWVLIIPILCSLIPKVYILELNPIDTGAS